MHMEERFGDNKNVRLMENYMIRLANPLLYDRLHTLSAEYSVSEELLVNVAVKRLLDDVDLIRSLRAGQLKLE